MGVEEGDDPSAIGDGATLEVRALGVLGPGVEGSDIVEHLPNKSPRCSWHFSLASLHSHASPPLTILFT